MARQRISWTLFLVEILSVFIGISLAFTLNRWNENRKDRVSEEKILLEIQNGLQADLTDIQMNINGHRQGQRACDKLNRLLHGEQVDTIGPYFDRMLFRDYVSIQNRSGYEALRSNGLQLVQNDSLRNAIISLYDFDYEVLQKLEEDYQEMQYFVHYHKDMNHILAPYMQIDSAGTLLDIQITSISNSDRDFLLRQLHHIKGNRAYAVQYYLQTLERIEVLDEMIKKEIDN